MKIIRLLLVTGLAIFALAWLSRTKIGKRTIALYGPKREVVRPLSNNTLIKLEQKAAAAKLFVQRKIYNETVCFLIDMSLPSGQNRFFVYDLKKDSVQSAGLVAHGNCFQNWLEGRKYSNVVGSGCTSLGKYKIGIPYTGKFGYSYKLLGLDSMNNNAFERTVVLHSYTSVPETEVSDEICQSNGCPMVSPKFFQKLKTIINASKKPVLLWIYE
jgi:hypothetical protein